uniref:HORMA domain-containing protein n=1 Tax=Steinernema glaseri TaxID=37863 RepID=A0A1I7Y7V2_9BILA
MKNDEFAESNKPTVMSVSSTDSSSSDCSNSQPDDETVASAKHYESVILQTTCDENGQIGARILSLGKERLEIALRENLDEVVKRKTPLTSNYMTELPHSNLSDPFFFNSQAVIIDRSDPSVAYAVKTVDDPENGLFAAFQAKLKAIAGMTPNSQKIVFRQIKIDCSAGKPSSGNTIWSNVTTHYRTGSAYCYVQDKESDTCSLWRLELDQSSSSDSESPSLPDEQAKEVDHPIVEVHSDMEGTNLRRKSPSKECRTLVRIDSDGTVTPETHHRVPSTSASRGSSSTHSTYDEISLEPYPHEATPVGPFRWVPLGESRESIGDNIVLRLEESTGLCCVRSTKKPSNGREDSRHCFILFPSQAPTAVF